MLKADVSQGACFSGNDRGRAEIAAVGRNGSEICRGHFRLCIIPAMGVQNGESEAECAVRVFEQPGIGRVPLDTRRMQSAALAAAPADLNGRPEYTSEHPDTQRPLPYTHVCSGMSDN